MSVVVEIPGNIAKPPLRRVKNLKIAQLLLSKTSSMAAHGSYEFRSRSIGMIGKQIEPRVVISASRSI